MRKMFTTLKSVVAATVIAAMALAASCSYDDSAINERVDRVEKDLAALTERVAALEKKLGEEVDALKKLIEKQTVVTKVEKADDGSTKVTLSDGSSFTVYPKAEAGAEAVDTTIAPNKDTDGTYYWAVFDGGKFQKYLEVDGKKVPVFAAEAEGCVCELKFQVSEETGKLLVSIDGGKTWVDSGLAAQQVASTGVFSDVVVNDDNTVTFTLADGDKFSVALAELIECEATRSGVYVLPGEVKAVRFTVNDAVEDINIMNQPHGWAASVEVAPAEEENGDENVDGPVAEPQAVGGTDYVLNIAGPAKEVANAGYAAKEGVVSVHFNTANGACKVLSVKVNLAEVTLSIDKAGNITLTNSVTQLFSDRQGVYYDFANFNIGVMPKALYDAYGNEALKKDFDDLYEEFVSYNETTRNTGLQNVVDLRPYEEGTYEKEVLTFTVDELSGAFWPKYTFELGGEYIIFVALEEETFNGFFISVLDNAVMATYSNVKVEAELVADSESWNDATFDFALAGYTYYIVGWHAKSEVENKISEGLCDSYADYLSKNSLDYLFGIGAVISGTVDGEVALSNVIKDYLDPVWGGQCMIPQIFPDTEYYFFVYPLNIQSMMDLYTHEFDVDALVLSSFTTAALVEGEFEATATFDKHEFGENNSINVPVKVSGNDAAEVVYAAYKFYDQPAYSPIDRVENMLADDIYTEYVKLDDTKAFNAYKEYGASNPCYLSVLLISADGEYRYFAQECVEYTEYEFTSCENTMGNTYVFKNDTYAWTLNLKDVLASGTFTQSGTEDTYWDGNSTTLKESTTANLLGYIYGGTLKVELGDNDALKVEFTSTDFTTLAGKKTPIKFVFDGTIGADQGGNAGAEIEVTSFEFLGKSKDIDNDSSTSGGDPVYKLVGADGNEYTISVYYSYVNTGDPYSFKVNSLAYCTNYLDYMHSSWAGFAIVSEQYYYESIIKIEEGRLTLNLVGVGTYVYEDEKIGAPEKAPEFTIPGDGVTYDLDLRYTRLVSGLDDTMAVKVADDNGYDWTIYFNSGLSSIEPGDYAAVQGFSTADAKEVDTYKGGIGYEYATYFYADEFNNVTINVQKNEDWYCITLIGQGGYDCPVSGKYRVVYIGKLVE